jgi:predicted SprT family Zn-dependent metalloprotease
MNAHAHIDAERVDPTKITYFDLTAAYDHFNAELFDGRLPGALITLQRRANCRGYFHSKKFASRDNWNDRVDEIALNPATFAARSSREILSTLVHEMVHLEQAHFGKPGRGAYHNREWAEWMVRIGLKPVSVDQPGKQVGNKVTHEIVPGERFDTVVAVLEAQGVELRYVEVPENDAKAKAKRASKTKYSCPACGANTWAKPEAHLICGDCDERMEPED